MTKLARLLGLSDVGLANRHGQSLVDGCLSVVLRDGINDRDLPGLDWWMMITN